MNTFTKVMDNVLAIHAGEGFSLVLKDDKSLWGCGDNGFGQLGDGTNGNKTAFTKIRENVQFLCTGNANNQSFIILNDNTIWATGHNEFGQLGDGTSQDKNIYIKINLP
jgi:alpha-tubulin suppressor-like RCC1 family protein